MEKSVFQKRLQRCGRLMKAAGVDVLLPTKPANMFYLTGGGRLCAYAMITHDGTTLLQGIATKARLLLGREERRPVI